MSKRKVAVYCHYSLMADHLFPIFQILKNRFSDRINIDLLFNPKRSSDADVKYMKDLFGESLVSARSWSVRWKKYDDMFVADHVTAATYKMARNIIHTGHGHASKIVGDEQETMPYEYDRHIYTKDGKVKYRWFIESSHYVRNKIVSLRPELSESIVVLGSAADDEYIQGSVCADAEKPYIVFLSTHGPESLIDYVIDRLEVEFDEISKSYGVVLDLHPLCGRNNAAAYARAMKLVERGAILKPEKGCCHAEAFGVLSDHTSMVQKVALVNPNILMIPIDTRFLWKDGATQMIADRGVRYQESQSLLENIESCKEAKIDPDLINSELGKFKENFSTWYEKVVLND